jgi:copper chaperone CopZ
MLEKVYKIEGMNCQHCVKSVEVELSEIGVEPIDIEIGSAKVKFDETKFSDKDIINAVDEAGFKIIS